MTACTSQPSNDNNSESASSSPSSAVTSASCSLASRTVALGAGCYWGTEKFIVKDFQKRFPNSIKNAKVGFMSPNNKQAIANPTYRQVCTGRTSHVEVLMVELADASLFEDLIRFFFMFHDPTTKDRQGNDRGTQYASAIFCSTPEQQAIADKVKKELQQFVTFEKPSYIPYRGPKIETIIVPFTQFYLGPSDHQEYLLKHHPFGYCNHRYRFRQWPCSIKNRNITTRLFQLVSSCIPWCRQE